MEVGAINARMWEDYPWWHRLKVRCFGKRRVRRSKVYGTFYFIEVYAYGNKLYVTREWSE